MVNKPWEVIVEMGAQHSHVECDAKQFAIGVSHVSTGGIARFVKNFGPKLKMAVFIRRYAEQRLAIDHIFDDFAEK